MSETEKEAALLAVRSNAGLEREVIIQMAVSAGFAHSPPPFKHWRGTINDLERFAKMIRQRSNVELRGRAL